jgi:hypothetical protein
VRETFAPANTVVDTPRFRAQPGYVAWGRSGWASGGMEVCAFSLFLSCARIDLRPQLPRHNLRDPLATDVTSADDDKMRLDSSLDAVRWRSLVWMTSTYRTSHSVPSSSCVTTSRLTNSTELPRHSPLLRAAQAGTTADGHGAGAMAGGVMGRRLSGCAFYIPLPPLYCVLRLLSFFFSIYVCLITYTCIYIFRPPSVPLLCLVFISISFISRTLLYR